jgi:hypothetical protein
VVLVGREKGMMRNLRDGSKRVVSGLSRTLVVAGLRSVADYSEGTDCSGRDGTEDKHSRKRLSENIILGAGVSST